MTETAHISIIIAISVHPRTFRPPKSLSLGHIVTGVSNAAFFRKFARHPPAQTRPTLIAEIAVIAIIFLLQLRETFKSMTRHTHQISAPPSPANV